METLGGRIRRRREELGLDQVTLAEQVGFSQPTLANLENGKNERTKFLPELARALHTTVEWLATGNGVPNVQARGTSATSVQRRRNAKERSAQEAQDKQNAVQIPRVRLKVSAGMPGVDVVTDDIEDNPIWLLKHWLQSRGYRHEHLVAIHVTDPSMEPALYQRDTIIINIVDTTPKDGAVFAVNYEGEALIRRMVRETGNWWLVCDNHDQRRYPRKRCTADACHPIGRVVYKQSEQI